MDGSTINFASEKPAAKEVVSEIDDDEDDDSMNTVEIPSVRQHIDDDISSDRRNAFGEYRTLASDVKCEMGVNRRRSYSDSEDAVIFCNNNDLDSSLAIPNHSEDLLSEINDILGSLSDDERFMSCIRYSNGNGFLEENGGGKDGVDQPSQVDIIFTYNVLYILYNKLKALKDYSELNKAQNNKLLKEMQLVEAENVATQIEVESLHETIAKQKREIDALQNSLDDRVTTFEKQRSECCEKYESELKFLRSKYENADNEKNAAIMKYVKNESELIDLRRKKDAMSKHLKSIECERDESVGKVKSLTVEKTQLSNKLEKKNNELLQTTKEMENLKEELNCKDIKFNWIEENLKKELNEYKERNSVLSNRIEELENAAIKNEDNFSVNTVNERHDYNNFTESDIENGSETQQENMQFVLDENQSLASKIHELVTEKINYENRIADLQQTLDVNSDTIKTLQEQLEEMNDIRSSLNEAQEKLSAYNRDMKLLQESNDELQMELDSHREKEAELLNFTQKLTSKNVALQSEYTCLEAKKMSLEADRIPINERIALLETNISTLEKQLEKEIHFHAAEIEKLKTRVVEQSKTIDSLNFLFEEQKAENQSLKSKYSSTVRELTKELQQYRRGKQSETGECSSGSDTVSLGSRVNSCNSLNEQQYSKVTEIDKQTLIERIVKLQKINIKQMEKIEFMEEHVSHLLEEVKKKSRVIQYYVLREQSGALSSKMFDEHKAELSKYGGIMASLYNTSKRDDNTLTLELSLEINQKLQAVLEDTILKNITLKENVETLGKEIEKLSCENSLSRS